jgi:choline dehydrogenase-like flavoprotein
MKQTARKLEGEFDYIIVGAGTAGCVLANRLTEDADVSVLLLEAGGKDDYHWIHVPVGYLYCIGNPRTDWLYKTQAEPGLNGRALSYPRGRVLGGCSSINGMIYMRGQREDYDEWAHLTTAAPANSTARAVNGASKSSASSGRSSRPFRRRRSKPASPPPTTSIAATTQASAISMSTRRAASAGTHRRHS